MLNKQTLISIEDALPGREQPMQIEDTHFVNQSSLTAPLQPHQQQILLGMGCFWGAERLFGNWMAWCLHPLAIQVDTQKTRLIKKCAPGKQGMRKSSEWSLMNE